MRCVLRALVVLSTIFVLAPALAADAPGDCAATVVALAATGSTIPGGELMPPESQPLAPDGHSCVSGFSSSVGGGASHHGAGADCTAATADLRSQLRDYADAECAVESPYGTCTFRVIHTTACYDTKSGGKGISGYTDFSCWMPI